MFVAVFRHHFGYGVMPGLDPGVAEDVPDGRSGKPAVGDDTVRRSTTRQPLQPVLSVRLPMHEVDKPDPRSPYHWGEHRMRPGVVSDR